MNAWVPIELRRSCGTGLAAVAWPMKLPSSIFTASLKRRVPFSCTISGVTRSDVPAETLNRSTDCTPATGTCTVVTFSSVASTLSKVITFGLATKRALPSLVSALIRAIK